MELYIFGRFLVLDGKENAFEAALGELVTATRAEAGCAEVHGYRSVRNARLYYLHSRWKNVEVFEAHAKLPHTETFFGAGGEVVGGAAGREEVREDRLRRVYSRQSTVYSLKLTAYSFRLTTMGIHHRGY